MRKVLAWIVLVSSLFVWILPATAQRRNDISAHPKCVYCNMDRRHYAHSRMRIVYDDGTVSGVCSLHCAAIDLAAHIQKEPVAVEVADYGSEALIDAESAIWVIGGNRPGVMTRCAKWAFERKTDAEAFIRKHGGTLATFDEAIKATYDDMHADSKMIRNKKKIRKMNP